MTKLKIVYTRFYKIFSKLVNLFRYRLIYLKIPVNNKLVFLESFQGRNFSDNPKAIYLSMINNKKYDHFKFVISLRDVCNESLAFIDLSRTKIVLYQTKPYYQAIAQAKYLVSNAVLDLSIIKKEEQVYLQTWHGTPLKKIGWDLNVSDNALNNPRKIKFMYLRDAKRYDLMCSASPYYTEKIISAFNLKNLNKLHIIKETGYPRNDRLVNYTNDEIIELKKKLKLPLFKKIILYAPTWREDKYNPESGYENNLSIDLDKLIEKVNDDYIIVLRLHYLVSNSLNIDHPCIYDLSSHHDINDLYLISDVLISDYSSAVFDYSILLRPMIYYLPDLDTYKNKARGLYFSVDSLPGPLTFTQEELVENINDINDVNYIYHGNITRFKKQFNPYEDGHSTQRIIDEMLSLKK